MKVIKNVFTPVILSLVMLISFSACAQKAEVKEIKIKTNFHCPNGKALLEKELIKETGVKTVVADVETKIVTITIEAGKTDQDKLVAAIEKIGYTTEFTKEGTEIKKACTHDVPPTQ